MYRDNKNQKNKYFNHLMLIGYIDYYSLFFVFDEAREYIGCIPILILFTLPSLYLLQTLLLILSI